LDDVLRRTRWTGDAIWPTQLPHGLITLDVIDQVCDIDLHRWTPVRGRRMGWHQYIPSSHSTTLESNMSVEKKHYMECTPSVAMPTSCTRIASAPASAIAARASSASRSSWSKTNVLNVTNLFTPRACNVCITSGSSANPKPTFALAVKCLSPKYTASAPASIAVLSCGQYPAGLISSGLFQTRFIDSIH